MKKLLLIFSAVLLLAAAKEPIVWNTLKGKWDISDSRPLAIEGNGTLTTEVGPSLKFACKVSALDCASPQCLSIAFASTPDLRGARYVLTLGYGTPEDARLYLYPSDSPGDGRVVASLRVGFAFHLYKNVPIALSKKGNTIAFSVGKETRTVKADPRINGTTFALISNGTGRVRCTNVLLEHH